VIGFEPALLQPTPILRIGLGNGSRLRLLLGVLPLLNKVFHFLVGRSASQVLEVLRFRLLPHCLQGSQLLVRRLVSNGTFWRNAVLVGPLESAVPRVVPVVLPAVVPPPLAFVNLSSPLAFVPDFPGPAPEPVIGFKPALFNSSPRVGVGLSYGWQ